jgi:hypothetical protein
VAIDQRRAAPQYTFLAPLSSKDIAVKHCPYLALSPNGKASAAIKKEALIHDFSYTAPSQRRCTIHR